MHEATLRRVIDESLAIAPNVQFIWHGGEPTIPGINYYRNMLEICEELRRPDQQISHSIQTNGTLLNKDWVTFLRENKFSIGVSIDGPEHIHNYARRDAAGEGTYHRTMKGIQHLRDEAMNFSTIAVVHSMSVNHPDDVFRFFYNHGISFMANPCTANPDDPKAIRDLAISPMDYARFVLRLMELWIETDNPEFRVRPVDDIIKGVLGKRVRLCRFRGQCHLYVTIDHNGDVYPCDGFLDPRYLLGNLTLSPFPSIIEGDEAIAYFQGRSEVQAGCGDCEWLSACQGACMRTWEGAKSIANPQDHEFCQARKLLFSQARDKLAAIGYIR
jgi:uncharacterized protein